MSFKSDPPDAILVITDLRDGKDLHVGTTPFTIFLKRGAGFFKNSKFKIMIEKPGYRREDILLEGSLFPPRWYIVDPLTAVRWTLDPEEINVTLKKHGAFPRLP